MSWPGPWWLYVFVAGLIFGGALFGSIPTGPYPHQSLVEQSVGALHTQGGPR